ncbi:dienelactone hydrolase family protein [Undibacterium sp.]|jgi:dienelactone hydrolase|uniref:dienelactone hydrolase family protein n=1 Tax=Undibacterium sp. TaxID=1914977 RepID=UPI002C691661|nr:dienelactone hydrolase family protein [Undibacterium sp.]HTD04308.1 dienelactone hydrolase family protein [Undibacterium sp.]
MHSLYIGWSDKRRFAFALLAALLVIASSLADAQVARMEILSFQSTTLTDQEFLTNRKEGKPVTLAGELRLPRTGNDKLPLVILLHGSGGISGYVTDWEQDFNTIGVATFVIDSFSARGIANTNNDQSQLGRLAMIVDAYRALELLARHPRIDPARIVLMGFSRGGQAALYASLNRFQRMHGPRAAAFSAYIPFYPDCSTAYFNDTDVADKPIRIFHGSADDYDPVDVCRPYVARLKATGKDAQLTEYAGAGHIFDWQALKTPVKLNKAQTVRHCRLMEVDGGVIVNAGTKQVFTFADPCVEYGPTIAYDEKSSTAARKAVMEFVTGLRPQ